MINARVLEEHGVLISVLLPMSRMLLGCAEQGINKVSGIVYEGNTHDG